MGAGQIEILEEEIERKKKEVEIEW